MAKTKNNKGLSNPAVLAAASSPAGQEAISNATATSRKLAETGISMIPFLVKTAILVGGVWYVFGLYTKRFIKLGTISSYPAANVSDGQAEAKADAIYEAMYGAKANKQLVAEQIAGLNYNGWVKVYNAFGHRKGILPFSSNMNLVEWLNDQFNQSDLNELRLLVNGVF